MTSTVLLCKKIISTLSTALFCTAANAGVLILTNGDRISGELIVVSDGQMHWQSDMVGEIVVPQINILSIEARDLFEVELDARRQLSECQMLVRADQTQVLNCKEGQAQISSWKQVSKVSARPLIEHDVWHQTGYVTAAAKDSAGNTNEQDLALDLKMSARRGSVRQSLIAAYNTQTQRDVKTSDARKVGYKYDYFVSEKWYLNGLLNWERNVFQDLESRRLFGGGIGYQFFDTDLIRLAVDGGLGYMTEQYSSDEDRKALVFREGTDFTYRINAFGLQFFHRNTYLLMFDRLDDWRIQSETGFNLPVVGRLNAQTKLKFDYMNIPADGAHAMDRTWLFGLNYSW
jgi:putative salt-induced outer membrane protein YdiY